MPHKKVEFTELFYDLVFVYAISKATGLIHHLHHGQLLLNDFYTFLSVVVLIITNWMFQTVYTNRYGHNSPWELTSTVTQMGILLFISNTFSADVSQWERLYRPFGWSIILITAIILGQYLIRFKECHRYKDKQVIFPFLKVLGFRLTLTSVGLFLPHQLGIPIFLAAIYISLFLPILFRRQMLAFPINFPYLVERISLLVIIILGEMLIGIADRFTPEHLSLSSLANLGIVMYLFLYYFFEVEHLMNKEQTKTTGMPLIYLHYPIFIGLLMTRVSLAFMRESEVHHTFLIGFLYSGLGLFYLSTLALSRYNYPDYRLSGKWLSRPMLILALSALLALLMPHHQYLDWLVLLTTFLLFIDLHRQAK